MKVKDLKEILANIDDDFDIEIMSIKNHTEDELKNMSYPFPFNFEFYELNKKDFNIGYSDKIIK